MAGTGQNQPTGSGDLREYVAGASDATTWAGIPADWVQVIGAGTTVVTTERGNSRTITTDALEPISTLRGPFTALVSTTATRVRMGYGLSPSSPSPGTAAGAGPPAAAPPTPGVLPLGEDTGAVGIMGPLAGDTFFVRRLAEYDALRGVGVRSQTFQRYAQDTLAFADQRGGEFETRGMR